MWYDDLGAYLWDTGAQLGRDPDLAADRIAQALGAPVDPVPVTE